MKSEQLLEQYRLKKTKGRLEVLKVFQKSDHALSQPDLENKVKSVDRTTLYRILYDFVDSGILHPVVSEKGLVHYSLCKENDCKDGHHQDNHVHFECRKCGNIFCLEEVKTPKVKIKKNFIVDKMDFKMSGVCRSCYKRRRK